MCEFLQMWPLAAAIAAAAALGGCWWARHQQRLSREMEAFYAKYPAARGRYRPWV